MGVRDWWRALVEARRRQRLARLAAELKQMSREAARASRPERSDDPAGEIERMFAVMDGQIGEARRTCPAQADELGALLAGYRERHGAHTILTSPHAAELRQDVLELERAMLVVQRQVPTGDPGYGHSLLAAGYAGTVVNHALDRTRKPGR